MELKKTPSGMKNMFILEYYGRYNGRKIADENESVLYNGKINENDRLLVLFWAWQNENLLIKLVKYL